MQLVALGGIVKKRLGHRVQAVFGFSAGKREGLK